MQQLFDVWTALDSRKRATVVIASIAVFALVLAMARLSGQPRFVLLYAGLEDSAAGAVIDALERQGQPYEIRGSSIFVDATARDELRLSLASSGLPENSSGGYELLDKLSGFGTTSQMFDAAYWRAKEGELARTILSVGNISSARVHIANADSNPFRRDIQPSAAVTITTNGGSIEPGLAKALRHLVSSAVPGLSSEKVSLIHGTDGLIGGDDLGTGQRSADDRAANLREKVQRLIEARVGTGNAVVEVSVETINESESIVERSFDPENRVIVSSDTEERSNTSEDSGGGNVTVASNLPEGDGAATDSSSSQNAETRERLNFEVSETMRELTRNPGGIRRLSVAVLVNGTTTTADDGTEIFEPLAQSELDALRDLIASAVGFDEERGDMIALKSLQFEAPEGLGTEAIPTGWSGPEIDVTSILQSALLAFVALVISLFVLRPVLARPAALSPPETGGALAPPSGAANDVATEPNTVALSGEIDTGEGFEPIADLADLTADIDFAAPSSEDPASRLRGLLDDRREETVEILRSWLDETETSEA